MDFDIPPHSSSNYVTPCPVCGSSDGSSLAQASALLAVCDVLVVRALESLGKRIVRGERKNFRILGNRPWHEAHTVIRADDSVIKKSFACQWDVIPRLLLNHSINNITSRQIAGFINSYAVWLVKEGRPHDIETLRANLEHFLQIRLAPSAGYVPEYRSNNA